MLRITVHDLPETLSFQLEGKLAGPWVRELDDCWQAALAGRGARPISVDLTAVTFVDGPGKELLSAIHVQGAQLVATGCLMKAIVAELSRNEANGQVEKV